jgi:DNA-binding response OmpR family regulator
MNGSFDGTDNPSTPAADGTSAGEPPRSLARVLVVNADRAVSALIEEWLGACGFAVDACNDCSPCTGARSAYSLVIVDLPAPRHGANERVQRIACDHPGAAVIALSSHFFPGIERTGAVARALGVACVLPKPLSRDSLIHAAQSLVNL